VDTATPKRALIPESRWAAITKNINKFLHREDKSKGTSEDQEGRVSMFAETQLLTEKEPMPTFEARMDKRDARENRRREKEKKTIDAMPAREKAAARTIEGKKIADFDADKKLRLEARAQAKTGSPKPRATSSWGAFSLPPPPLLQYSSSHAPIVGSVSNNISTSSVDDKAENTLPSAFRSPMFCCSGQPCD
jgi:hypothetical protein